MDGEVGQPAFSRHRKDDEHRARRQMELRPYIIHARPAQAAMQCAAAFTVALAASAAISGSSLAEYAAVPEALEAEQEQSSCSQVGSPLASFDESAILLISFPNLENDELDASVDELYYGALLSRRLSNSS